MIVLIFLLLAGYFLPSCEEMLTPSGGGSIHIAPIVQANYKTIFQIELNTWGSDSDDLAKRYTKIKFHYKQKIKDKYKTIDMNIREFKNDKLHAVCELPPLNIENGDKVYYYFDMLFDGHYNKREEEAIVIKVPK